MSTTRETLKAIHERGDLLPWLNGETDYYFNGEKDYLGCSLNFDSNPEKYTFRPKPALRPWNSVELWEHRDCWFCEKGYRELPSRIVDMNLASVVAAFVADTDVSAIRLLADWEHLAADGQTWLPCGTVE
jgi:hypothetical protein